MTDPVLRAHKRAGYCAIICTFLYLALFLPSFYIFMFSPHLFENAGMTDAIGVAIIFFSLWVPLSIVISLAMIWFMYFRNRYKGMYFFCAMPVITSIVVLLVLSVIRALLS
jgi:hypothetical protein